MARKLKTYQTSLGFFDLAIAAPSMKAALEAWGADSNLFHQGAARESHDPDVIAATLAKPGVVLKRPVGSDGPFREHADLPTDLDDTDKPAKVSRKSKAGKPKKSSSRPADKAAERKEALAYEREQKSRDREREKEEAAREKERERRQASVDKAQAALDQAAREHAEKAESIQAQMEALERRSQAEDARWDKERRRLEKVLRRARD
ncbi:flagellar biosynthesis GTPase FlhF [Bradyrhizobium sp. RT9b]|uniref:cell envelope biogenesis protein TolA n=1 Tax=Bradyrhizobium sp. RT9b TaxID=3156385 RepID=UPI003391C927